MNPTGSNPTPPPLPPTPAEPEPPAPLTGAGDLIEALLRRPASVLHHFHQSPGARTLVGFLFLLAVLAAGAYGVIVGSFSGGTQLWAAPLKIAGGLLLCGLICLPSLYVFACLSGSSAGFVDVAGMVAGLLALMTLLLVSFSPVAWVFSQSTESVGAMGTLHLAFWIVATYFGARFMYRGMVRLGARGEGAFYFWISLFVVVCLQMTTALRPLVGKAPTLLPVEKRFFLQHWLEQLREPAGGGPREPRGP
ncbi:MAG: hypothetical protein JNL10_06135 [Verrucomicrobiales bacterium]|nr:hypothetical protein [Verrucomicrobiales bacterium]